ncbi:MAG: NUDIX domain-containing protein [Gammaproteobacteria bacterium]|nr:NUDIX domain-containing protein [Gammaproteobacteria bacterium]
MSEISYARPSSTVVLTRPGPEAPELFMVRRHAKSAFGSAYAFPGGVVEDDDAAVYEFCAGLTAAEANRHLGVKSNGLDLYSAAIRELFEETGVLLADIGAISEDLAVVRDGLNADTDRWLDFVARNKLDLHCDRLHYFSHWITPQIFDKRFSTRFFVAEMLAGQRAEHCGGELTDSRWSTAHDMLDAGRSGEVRLHFPTIKTLELIARYKTFDELLTWARSCAEWGVTSMLPAIIERDGDKDIVLPGERDYPGAKT